MIEAPKRRTAGAEPGLRKARCPWSTRWLVGLLLAGGLALGACGEGPATPDASPEAVAAEKVENGRYLVTVGHCHDCHTPFEMGPNGPEPDMTLALSGHPEDLEMPPPPITEPGPWVWAAAGTNTAFAGPWGVSFSANLTPHASGMGAWTEEIFIEAMRTGKHWGQSRPILPPMPWQNMARMTDEDLAAVFAYLKSVPPIENHVPEPIPPATPPAAPAPTP